MKIIVTLTMLLLLTASLFSTTWTINQDGTGDFTTISAGITAAVDGDTILVYPGIYYENIDYQGKNITITSLYDGDQYDESYIANTIIDGNQENSVVRFTNNESRDAVLHGFTLRNGLANGNLYPDSRGGGVYISYASPTISHCIIRDNTASWGGGVYLYMNGSVLLTGNRIFNNHSLLGGAVTSNMDTDLVFCTESLNSVYLNYSARGTDLYMAGRQQSPIIVDTLTVLEPDLYFALIRDSVPNEFSITINHGKIEPVHADLYVSPEGCDSNSGLSPDHPLHTVSWAMMKIAPDSLQQRTIHLAEGVYSPSLNNQYFPIGTRSFIDVIGANKETTIIDLEGRSHGFNSFNRPSISSPAEDSFSFTRNFSLKNLSLINGSGTTFGASVLYAYYNSDFTLENIDIYETNSNKSYTAYLYHGDNITLKNIHIYDTSGGKALGISSHFGVPLTFNGENIRIRNNVPHYPFHPDNSGIGGGMRLDTGGANAQPLNATIANLEISDCVIDNVGDFGNIPVGQFKLIGPNGGQVRIVNATIGNNWSGLNIDAGIFFSGTATYELINSIVYGNTPHEVGVMNHRDQTGNVFISHSLVGGGEDELYYFNDPNVVVHWGEGNLDADPLWMGDTLPDYPYMLSEKSPARNAGTLDIPDFEFPEFDLAGNPRIYGDSIDMGAYEWNPVSVEQDFVSGDLPEAHDYKLYNYPNPVVSMQSDGNRGGSTGTSISFQLPKNGHVAIDIYNLKGQFVRRVIDAYMRQGAHKAFWDGRDDLERYVATGFYMYKLEIDGKMVATGRATFIK
jgi:hypothetical protein